jgi:hypothetical protein
MEPVGDSATSLFQLNILGFVRLGYEGFGIKGLG